MHVHGRFGRHYLLAVVSLLGVLAANAQPPNNLIVTFAGTGYAGYSGGDGHTGSAIEGPARFSALNHPEGMVFDSNGNLYVAESADHRVRKIDVNGNITTVAGGNGPGFSGDTGAATLAQLNYPIGLAVDGVNNLYIVDRSNVRIRKVDATTGKITTVAGNGGSGPAGDNGPATSAQLNFPWGVASDAAGNLYIGDEDNFRVRKVAVSTGTITTVAGNGTQVPPATGAQPPVRN